MTDKDKQILLDEIERLKTNEYFYHDEYDGFVRNALDKVSNFINSLPEETVSEELGEAAKNHAYSCYTDKASGERIAACIYDFKAGAKWDRKHILSKIDVNAMLADYQAEVGINNYVQIYSKGIEAVLKKIKEL